MTQSFLSQGQESQHPECVQHQGSTSTGQAYSNKYEIITWQRHDRRRQHMMDEPGKENMNKAGRERDRTTDVTQTVDGGMGVKGKTKDGLKEEERKVEVLASQASRITPLLLPFFYFCLLRNSVTSSR